MMFILLERPDVYEMGGLFGGGSKPKLPPRPIMQTGLEVETKSVEDFDEEADAKKQARRTARKGTSQFRIPLADVIVGAKATESVGLKI